MSNVISSQSSNTDPESAHGNRPGQIQRSPSSFLIMAAVLVLLVLCVVLILFNRQGSGTPQSGPQPALGSSSSASLLASDTLTRTEVLYMTLIGAGDATDIFRFDPGTDKKPVNLTNSAGVSETWPVVSPDGSMLAYFGASGGAAAELYVLNLVDGHINPITTKTGTTDLHNGYEIDTNQPPIWSLEGFWLAFLAQQTNRKGNAVELYVAQNNGKTMLPLTHQGNRVRNPIWLSDDQIAYIEERGNGKATVYRLVIGGVLAPKPVATLELSH